MNEKDKVYVILIEGCSISWHNVEAEVWRDRDQAIERARQLALSLTQGAPIEESHPAHRVIRFTLRHGGSTIDVVEEWVR